jgi:hypothetical protein
VEFEAAKIAVEDGRSRHIKVTTDAVASSSASQVV